MLARRLHKSLSQHYYKIFLPTPQYRRITPGMDKLPAMVPVVFKLRPAEKDAARRRAYAKGESFSEYVRRLVRSDLAPQKNGRVA